MNIRNIKEEELSEVIRLQAKWKSSGNTWGYKALSEEELKKIDRRLFWVVEDNNSIVGYAFCNPRDNDGACIYKDNDKILEIEDIYLKEEFRGKGIGTELLNTIEQKAKEQGFTTLLVYSSVKDIDRVIGFYRKSDFNTWFVQMFKDL